jgi:hypothetical protein
MAQVYVLPYVDIKSQASMKDRECLTSCRHSLNAVKSAMYVIVILYVLRRCTVGFYNGERELAIT